MNHPHLTSITQYVKEVVMDAPGDYAAYVDGEYLGSRRTRQAAEELCDEYVYRALLAGEVR